MRLESQRITNFKNEDVSPIVNSTINFPLADAQLNKQPTAMLDKIGGILAF